MGAGGGHGGLQITNPDFEQIDDEEGGETLHTGRIVPVYEKAGAVWPKQQRRLVHDALLRLSPDLRDPVPESTRARADTMACSAVSAAATRTPVIC